MRVQVASGNEIIIVVVFAAIVAFMIGTMFMPNQEIKQEEIKKEEIVEDPEPVWESRGWQASQDYQYNRQFDIYPSAQPMYAGHPMLFQEPRKGDKLNASRVVSNRSL